MRKTCSSGSVEGVMDNHDPYSDHLIQDSNDYCTMTFALREVPCCAPSPDWLDWVASGAPFLGMLTISADR
jgi:hypothetical protein